MESMKFGPLTIRFDDRVLRPRPWTIAQSVWAAELAEDAPRGGILELCAGVGHIGLALASQVISRDLVMVDANPTACEYARDNAKSAGLAGRVEVRQGRIEYAIEPTEQFALILADPPWMPSGETAQFPQDPLTAIDGGPDGLVVARVCLEIVARHLMAGGLGVLQLRDGHQANGVRRYIEAHAELQLRVDEIRPVPAANGTLVKLSSATEVR